MDTWNIRKLTPNRPRSPWVDAVVRLDEDQIQPGNFSDPAWPLFEGCSPGDPILPAAMRYECVDQAAAILIADPGVSAAGKIPVVARAHPLKFRQLVWPGDHLDMCVTLETSVGNVFCLRSGILREGQTVASLDFATTATDPGGTTHVD